MQPTKATSGSSHDPSDGFWDRYAARLRAQGVKPTAVRWYVIRAEQYLQAIAHKRLPEHTPQDVTDYLEKLGRIGRMAAWQYCRHGTRACRANLRGPRQYVKACAGDFHPLLRRRLKVQYVLWEDTTHDRANTAPGAEVSPHGLSP